MKCPFCGSRNNHVINTRESDGGNQVRRRRDCHDCNERFTTREAVDQRQMFVIKSDDTRQPFDREKMLRGIALACRKRPVSTDQMDQVVATIERKIQRDRSKEVSTKQLGDMILLQMRDIDEVAYVRFASVYRAFKSIREFNQEMKKLTSR